ncbi:MAG: hypothetical protein AB8B55_11255 [Mariniblastus sp.]
MLDPESTRGNALYWGLPSILLALAGVAILCWAQFGMANSLEDSYRFKAEESGEKKKVLVKELNREARMLRASQRTAPEDENSAIISKDDPRVIELEKLREEESIYLEKLISLSKDNPEYLYSLALVAGEQGDVARREALMRKISPLDEPGYGLGHIWLAKMYLRVPLKDRSKFIKSRRMALQHAEHCLRRDQDHELAKQIKASMLIFFEDNSKAYDVYLDLFRSKPKKKPKYISALYELNVKLKREDRNSAVLNEAITEFDKQIAEEDLSDSERSNVWRSLIICFQRLQNYEMAETRLLEEIKKQAAAEGGEGKRVWAERLLASVYLSQMTTVKDGDPKFVAKRLSYLKKAFRYDPTNARVLEQIVRIGGGDSQEAAEARKLYYPTKKFSNTPPIVLNELGTQALSKSEYAPALRFFRMAKSKDPRNPAILNNLAYTYLVGDNPNPERALKLVDEAIKFLPRDAVRYKDSMSSFHDTKGHALMQLNKMTDAILQFEKALRARSENRRILEALIKCCEADGINASAYINRLEQLDRKEALRRKTGKPVQTP